MDLATGQPPPEAVWDGTVGHAPDSLEEAALTMAEEAARGRTVRPMGAGTKRDWCFLGRPGAHDVTLSTRALARVLEHAPGDLTVTCEGGITLVALCEVLARHGQWLPADPPFMARATLGGTLATGINGPRRSRHGPLRDRVLAMRVAYATGEVARSGARVVKNVAGYDVHRLHVGAFGTLGLIGEVTLKVAPLPPARALVAARYPTPRLAVAAALEMASGRLAPAILSVAHAAPPLGGGPWLLAGFEDQPPAVRRAVDDVTALWRRDAGQVLVLEGGDAVAVETSVRELPACCVSLARVACRPSRLAGLASRLAEAGAVWTFDAISGSGLVGWVTGAAVPDGILGALAPDPGDRAGPGGLPVGDRPESVAWLVPVRGLDPIVQSYAVASGMRVMRAVKEALDPRGTLAPGLF